MALNLPVVLAGPIVRRVTTYEINVWICTSKELDIGIGVYETKLDKEPFSKGEVEIGKGKAIRRLHLGEKLYIYLLKALPTKAAKEFLPGKLLAYDICYLNLKTEKLGVSILTSGEFGIRKDISLTGNWNALPTIVLQKNSRMDLRALFASCRKLHGPGKDAFVETLITKYKQPYSNLTNRPNALFLMGDQIYADDVSDLLLPRLEELSEVLIGLRNPYTNKLTQEEIPRKNGKTLPKVTGLRQGISVEAGFTTTKGSNHLMRFGEFVGMYLLSWSGNEDLWPLKFLDEKKDLFFDISKNCRIKRAKGNETASDRKKAKAVVQGLRDIVNLQDARKGSLSLRKILANTPTYMIFDDHDITDDWNINPAWKNCVENNPTGRRIVANALAAYTLFQGWGNDPESFMDNPLLHIIEERFAKQSMITSETYENELFNFEKWSFLAPTVPPTLFIDTRTRRERSPVEFTKEWRFLKDTVDVTKVLTLTKQIKGLGFQNLKIPLPKYDPKNWKDTKDFTVPILIGPRIIEHIKSLIPDIKNQSLIIVTPGPIFDVPLIEYGKGLHSFIFGVVEDDLEGWMTNKHSIMQLIQVLQSVKNLTDVVMLSGDVHYSFSVSGKIQGRTFKLFNSSAAKNAPEGITKKIADNLGKLSGLPNQANESFYFWEDKYNQINSGSSIVLNALLTNGMLPALSNEKYYKNLCNFETNCIPLVIDDIESDSLVTTNCNIGYLYSEDAFMSKLIMGK